MQGAVTMEKEQLCNKTAQQADRGGHVCTWKSDDLWSGHLQRDSVYFPRTRMVARPLPHAGFETDASA